jgi:hypothetical protein
MANVISDYDFARLLLHRDEYNTAPQALRHVFQQEYTTARHGHRPALATFARGLLGVQPTAELDARTHNYGACAMIWLQ